MYTLFALQKLIYLEVSQMLSRRHHKTMYVTAEKRSVLARRWKRLLILFRDVIPLQHDMLIG